jgi:hypothetical protein
LEIKLKIDFRSVGKVLVGIFVGLAMLNLVQNNPFLEDFPRKVGFVILSMILTVVILSFIKD